MRKEFDTDSMVQIKASTVFIQSCRRNSGKNKTITVSSHFMLSNAQYLMNVDEGQSFLSSIMKRLSVFIGHFFHPWEMPIRFEGVLVPSEIKNSSLPRAGWGYSSQIPGPGPWYVSLEPKMNRRFRNFRINNVHNWIIGLLNFKLN